MTGSEIYCKVCTVDSVDEKARTATLTARGIAKAEAFFSLENLSDPENSTIAHHINQAIKAHGTMKRDVDYVVKDGDMIYFRFNV